MQHLDIVVRIRPAGERKRLWFVDRNGILRALHSNLHGLLDESTIRRPKPVNRIHVVLRR